MFTKSKSFLTNYATEVVKIDNVRKHENSDNLDIVTIHGNNVIVARGSVAVGQIMCYAPVECSLNKEFLAANNQFEDKSLNKDQEVKGFFNKHGRVRAIKLRGEASQGFLFPLQWIVNWRAGRAVCVNDSELVGVEFDTVDGVEFSKKYVPVFKPRHFMKTEGNRRNKHLKRFDKLIDGQFNFHVDTEKFEKNIHKLMPTDIISITHKLHGTSGISSYILVNKEFNLFEKCLDFVLKCFGKAWSKTSYDYIYSSRSVIKNRYINKGVKHFYGDVDIWGAANERIKPFLKKGMTMYYEIVGYLPNSQQMIQKRHDYGCKDGEFEIYVYRITETNVDGQVHEYSALQVQQYCKKMGIKAVPELYYGYAYNLYNIKAVNEHDWRTAFLSELKHDKTRFHMEARDPMCVNEVPMEGLCIRREGIDLQVFKLKTESHYQLDSRNKDAGEVDIEEVQESEV